MIVHVALADTLEGPLGLAVDAIDTAARLLRAGMATVPAGALDLRQRVLSCDGAPVPSAHGRAIAVDGAFGLRGVRRGDVWLIPGVRTNGDAAVDRLLARPDVRQLVALLPLLSARGVTLAASCAATFVLAAAGLLAGGSATTTWWLTASFARRFPGVELTPSRIVVDHGAVLTAGSAFAHADLVLAVLARIGSPGLAELVARYLVLDARTAQSRYMLLDPQRSADPTLRALEAHILAHLDRQLELDELARVAGTSPRTLARKVHAAVGLSPQRFVQQLRIHHARALLREPQMSVEAVAARVGYADAAAFRRIFRRITGETPRGRSSGAAMPR